MDRIPHADEIGRGVGDFGVAREVLVAEPDRALLALEAKGIALDRAAVLVDVLDGFGGDPSRGPEIALQRPHAPADPDRRRHAAVLEHAADAAHGVGAAAEAEEVNAVAWLPDANDLGVAVDDVLGDAEAGCLAQQVVDAAKRRDLDGLGLGAGA